jgi:hypothetical protein
MSLIPTEPFQPLSELAPPSHYRTPTAVQSRGIVMAGIEGPDRIRLLLEDGYKLETPMTQNAIDGLYEVSGGFRTPVRFQTSTQR